MKKIRIALTLIVLIAACAVGIGFATGFIETPGKHKSEQNAKTGESLDENTPRVTLTVEITKVLDTEDYSLPENDEGYILNGEYALTEGESIFDIVSRVFDKEDIDFAYSGGDFVYIKSIAGLSELDLGDMSGWLYEVNGEAPMVACTQLIPENGDVIHFYYVDSFEMEEESE